MYFVKKGPVPVSKVTPGDTVIPGDLSPKVVDQLASLVEEVSSVYLIQNSLHSVK